MPEKKRMGQSKCFAFLKVTAHVSDQIIKLDGIEFKNQTIKIEKARTQYLSKPHKATIRPRPVLMIIRKTKTGLFEIFQAIKAMLKLQFHKPRKDLQQCRYFWR